MNHDLHNLIGGELRGTTTTLDNLAPGTGEKIGTIPASTSADVDEAVAAAKAAFPGWSKTPYTERADCLDAIADGIEARLEEFSALESLDTGKPVSLARRIDIPRSIANFRFFAGAIRHTRDDAHRMADALNYTVRRPIGVVGLITPWNLPLYLLSWKIAPALAMGNTIVAKPSELSPLTAAALGDLTLDLGLPPGALNIVHGDGAGCGAPLTAHADVKAISFTGGTVTGRRVAATTAEQFKKVSLELGGKNATLVFEDADLDAAVAGAVRAGFTNQGQVCLCGSRVFVHRKIYDAFVEKFVTRVKAMKVGDPAAADTEVGALISSAHREKIEGYVSLAKEEGGTVVCGGERLSLSGAQAGGFFFEPTVVTGLSPRCRTATEEIFGPVVTVHPFDSDGDAIAMANGVDYGLAASLWTRDLVRAHRVSEALETGMVWVNCWLHRDLRVPFGGMKNSGVGREGGEYSLSFFSEARNICIHLGVE